MKQSLFIAAVGLALVVGWTAAAEPDTGTADEEILKTARLSSDGPALLEFFRKRTPSDGSQEKIQALVRQLGDDSFEVREKASAELIALGIVAVPFLEKARKDTDAEVNRRAEDCLRLIQTSAGTIVPAAAARLVALRKPAGAAEVLLTYLPFANTDGVADEIRNSLAAVAVRDGQPEKVVLAALTDKMPARRAAAAEALVRAGAKEQGPAVRQLLQDPDPTVRLRVALNLARAQEKAAIPVLIELLAQLPQTQGWLAEDLLIHLAGEQSPRVSLGNDDASRVQARDAWKKWWGEQGDKTNLARLTQIKPLLGYTMIVLLDLGKVLELDAAKKVRWEINGFEFPLDAQLLPNGNVLAAEHRGSRVTERNLKGEVVWERKVDNPLVAQRLPNGNTFIATRTQLLEVDRDGKEVFTHNRPNGELIMRAQKLRNGQMVIATSGQRFVRLDATGKEIQTFPVDVRTSGGRIDVLPNGNVLIPLLAINRVVEYNAEGKSVWEAAVDQPIAAVRLANGHTLVTSLTQNRAVELDRSGKEMWEYRMDNTRVSRAFRR